jgi:phage shock protein E
MKGLMLFFMLALSAVAYEGKHDGKFAQELVKKGAMVLDVRTLIEYKVKHIDGAKRIPVDEVKQNFSKIKKLNKDSKENPIVVYCMSGGRSARAKMELEKAGFKNVYDLGGMSNWFRAQE